MPAKYTCECGMNISDADKATHSAGKQHKKRLEERSKVAPKPEQLDHQPRTFHEDVMGTIETCLGDLAGRIPAGALRWIDANGHHTMAGSEFYTFFSDHTLVYNSGNMARQTFKLIHSSKVKQWLLDHPDYEE